MVYQTQKYSSLTSLVNITDYYPFGKELRFYKGEPNEKFLSTQHERDRASNYDHRQARNSTSEFEVFLSVDPLASEFTAWTPYHYVHNNPVNLIDPDGRIAVKVEGWIPINTVLKENGFKSREQTLFPKGTTELKTLNVVLNFVSGVAFNGKKTELAVNLMGFFSETLSSKTFDTSLENAFIGDIKKYEDNLNSVKEILSIKISNLYQEVQELIISDQEKGIETNVYERKAKYDEKERLEDSLFSVEDELNKVNEFLNKSEVSK